MTGELFFVLHPPTAPRVRRTVISVYSKFWHIHDGKDIKDLKLRMVDECLSKFAYLEEGVLATVDQEAYDYFASQLVRARSKIRRRILRTGYAKDDGSRGSTPSLDSV